MANTYGVVFTAGGEISGEAWTELLEHLDGWQADEWNGQLNVSDSATLSQYEDLFGELIAAGLAVRMVVDGDSESGPEIHAWFPGMASPEQCESDGKGAAIPLNDLRKAAAENKTLDMVIAEHAHFDREIPPLLIDGRPLVDADIRS